MSNKYLHVALAGGLLLLFGAVAGSDWRGTTELHTLSEVVATLTALMVGVVALVRCYAKKNNTYLFIGTGFFGTALLDGYHAVVTSSFFSQWFPSAPPSLIPWSWNASRTFLALLLWLSYRMWKREQDLGEAGAVRENTVFAAVGGLTVLSFCFFAFVPLPRAYYPEYFFGRPEEFVAATLFAVALAGYCGKGEWRRDPFENMIVVSLIIGVIASGVHVPFIHLV